MWTLPKHSSCLLAVFMTIWHVSPMPNDPPPPDAPPAPPAGPAPVASNDDVRDPDATPPPTEGPTTQRIFTDAYAGAVIRTPIPEADVERAIRVNVERYSKVDFSYYNGQHLNNLREMTVIERCYEDWMRCGMSLTYPEHICAYRDLKVKKKENAFEGNLTHHFKNFCDLHLDNCRRGYRYWRSYNRGYCTDKYLDTYVYHAYEHWAHRHKNISSLF